MLKAGKQITAQNNRPDVGDVFAEHRKAGHQKDAGDGRTADAGMAELYNADGSCHNDARIEEGRTKAAHRAVIGDEGIGVQNQLPLSDEDVERAIHHKCKQNHRKGNCPQNPLDLDRGTGLFGISRGIDYIHSPFFRVHPKGKQAEHIFFYCNIKKGSSSRNSFHFNSKKGGEASTLRRLG